MACVVSSLIVSVSCRISDASHAGIAADIRGDLSASVEHGRQRALQAIVSRAWEYGELLPDIVVLWRDSLGRERDAHVLYATVAVASVAAHVPEADVMRVFQEVMGQEVMPDPYDATFAVIVSNIKRDVLRLAMASRESVVRGLRGQLAITVGGDEIRLYGVITEAMVEVADRFGLVADDAVRRALVDLEHREPQDAEGWAKWLQKYNEKAWQRACSRARVMLTGQTAADRLATR